VQPNVFCSSANAIFCHTKHVSEYARLNLIESFASKQLCFEAINLPIAQLRHLNVCWNNVYRKIFSMHIMWASVKDVQFYSGRLDVIHILHLRKLNSSGRLLHGRPTHRNNSVVSTCGKSDG